MREPGEYFTMHGWTMRVYADHDVWRWVVDLGSVRFDDLILACQEGHPSQVYPSFDEARVAAIQWAVENER
jgi:hypothetical protein